MPDVKIELVKRRSFASVKKSSRPSTATNRGKSPREPEIKGSFKKESRFSFNQGSNSKAVSPQDRSDSSMALQGEISCDNIDIIGVTVCDPR